MAAANPKKAGKKNKAPETAPLPTIESLLVELRKSFKRRTVPGTPGSYIRIGDLNISRANGSVLKIDAWLHEESHRELENPEKPHEPVISMHDFLLDFPAGSFISFTELDEIRKERIPSLVGKRHTVFQRYYLKKCGNQLLPDNAEGDAPTPFPTPRPATADSKTPPATAAAAEASAKMPPPAPRRKPTFQEIWDKAGRATAADVAAGIVAATASIAAKAND